MKKKVWFITGISRGFGRALAQAAILRGDLVIGTTRDGGSDLEDTGSLHVLTLEVTDREQVFSTVADAYEIHRRFDVVVNNAGYGLIGSVESTSCEEARRVLDVNFFGTLHVTQAVLPFLRKQRSGHIVNISSIAGIAPAPGSGLYAAAKCAVEGMSTSLRQELAPLGIRVTLVEPGAFRTDFLNATSVRYTPREVAEYDSTVGKIRHHLIATAGRQIGDPERGAAAILLAVDAETPPMHLLLGPDALGRARARLEEMTQQVDEWLPLTLSTGFAGFD